MGPAAAVIARARSLAAVLELEAGEVEAASRFPVNACWTSVE